MHPRCVSSYNSQVFVSTKERPKEEDPSEPPKKKNHLSKAAEPVYESQPPSEQLVKSPVRTIDKSPVRTIGQVLEIPHSLTAKESRTSAHSNRIQCIQSNRTQTEAKDKYMDGIDEFMNHRERSESQIDGIR
eukprot:926394_1